MSSSYQEDNNAIWLPMNTNSDHRMEYQTANTILHNKNYHFEPIDHDFATSIQTSNSHAIQRPIPVTNYQSNTVIERPKKQHQYGLPSKRYSAMNSISSDIDSTIHSYTLSRSMTSDRLTNHHKTTKKLCYYPSVQDVLDALDRTSFEKESFV